MDATSKFLGLGRGTNAASFSSVYIMRLLMTSKVVIFSAGIIMSAHNGIQSIYMRAGGNFTKCNHENYITKINILVIFKVFSKFSDHDNLKIYAIFHPLTRFPIWYHTS